MEYTGIIKRGRGRPRGKVSRRITIHIAILPEIDAAVEERASELGIPKGQYIERAVKGELELLLLDASEVQAEFKMPEKVLKLLRNKKLLHAVKGKYKRQEIEAVLRDYLIRIDGQPLQIAGKP